ncbi:nucleoside hydrolase [Clostridium sartagoforme]|uniref:Nucleoside hydrolase n=1 Tax=Clostridium sartagoforme TaxID=84031 RepID=A0A4S2DML2_9CLOT|nr:MULTISPECIES: nucleoside hydrolase [Clostridium]MBS5936848.1 nucleoside hydrolase [Clostridium sp.]TGY43566.1 nucleoside hydrolase [Clostridium sartagoforme]
MTKLEKHKVIIDCDPGADDALAIMLALNSEEIDVIGITTVSGNSPLEICTQNALNIINSCNRKDIPVFAGEDRPIKRDIEFTDEYCGKNGVCEYEFRKSDKLVQKENAIDFIYDSAAREEKLTIISIAPMSNIAKALIKYPDLKDMNIEIITMAGYYKVNSSLNVKRSEWNVLVDPEAFEIVCNSGIPMYSLGLDVSSNLKNEYIDEIIEKGTKSEKMEYLIHAKDFYLSRNLTPKSLLVDSLPVAYIIDKSIAKFKAGNVTMQYKEKIDCDIIKFNSYKDKANIYAAYELDLDRFVKILIERIFNK